MICSQTALLRRKSVWFLHNQLALPRAMRYLTAPAAKGPVRRFWRSDASVGV